MRILILGAGATGGYFGGRLAQSGADVTFLVRPARAERLAAAGLTIQTPEGRDTLSVRTTTADTVGADYDLVVLSCKAYDLDSGITAITPAVGPATTVLPILNGLLHYDRLDAAFGQERVLGGLCAIFASLGPAGEIVRAGPLHRLTFGERDGGDSARVAALATLCAGADFHTIATPALMQAAWEKFSFLAAVAAATCLMRADIGTINATDYGPALLHGLYDETCAVAAAHGHAPAPAARAEVAAMLDDTGSKATASMLRDLEAGHRTEGEHILGDMVRRAQAKSLAAPLLTVAHAHVQAYERRRAASA